jgi:hypothetical protein
MSARFLATFCLLISSMSIAMAATPSTGIAAISLRLRSGTVAPAAFEELRRELVGLMNTAGVAARWEDPTSYRDVNGSTVVVDLEGDCTVPFHREIGPVPDGSPLASTAAADNQLLPFVTVNCGSLAALMGPFIADQPEAFREFAFGRALGRVLAHELYHIVTRSADHLDSGVAKASFSANDLLKNRFEFDDMAVGRIHASEIASSAPEAFDSGAGSGFGNATEGK